MTHRSLRIPSLAALLLACLFAAHAMAHHGWSWAEAEQIELTGTVERVQIAPPHPWLEIETEDDGTWRVELGNPRGTERAGFVEGSAQPGDRITAVGNRSKDRGEKRMKAVQLTVGDRTYDIYPERIQP
ncbi:DUF6152 family protein [Stutzerimonas tarimensis]|uniref:DUF6152 family protein n=1 Tax=Stutzerimonas tarimensis TaxID=1507735 RepID=A0ABV7T7W7_9GAMM